MPTLSLALSQRVQVLQHTDAATCFGTGAPGQKRAPLTTPVALVYACRADDLLVHTSGEMSNPLPTEQRLIAECPTVLTHACLVGTGLARCAALLQLAEGIDPASAELAVDVVPLRFLAS